MLKRIAFGLLVIVLVSMGTVKDASAWLLVEPTPNDPSFNEAKAIAIQLMSEVDLIIQSFISAEREQTTLQLPDPRILNDLSGRLVRLSENTNTQLGLKLTGEVMSQLRSISESYKFSMPTTQSDIYKTYAAEVSALAASIIQVNNAKIGPSNASSERRVSLGDLIGTMFRLLYIGNTFALALQSGYL